MSSSNNDQTKQLLEQILAGLYQEQQLDSGHPQYKNDSFLLGGDNAYLGRITNNSYDQLSLLNNYGPYGSPYSNSSIFNQYSPYGSVYGEYSIRNPYCQAPPKLYIKGRFIGNVSANPYISQKISPEGFLYALKNQMSELLKGNVCENEKSSRSADRQSFMIAEDGTFLGKVNPNRFDSESIHNRFGSYGNKFSTNSIFNSYSKYGGLFSPVSAYNSNASTPPKLYLNGKLWGYVSKNVNKKPRIDPDDLIEWSSDNLNKNG